VVAPVTPAVLPRSRRYWCEESTHLWAERAAVALEQWQAEHGRAPSPDEVREAEETAEGWVREAWRQRHG
jgi:hypothetical protein